MPDAFFSTSTTSFDKTVVPLILRAVQAALRGGLAYTPKGSVIPATHVKGTNATFRSVGYGDLPEDGDVNVEDGQADPDVEDIAIDYVEFTGQKRGRTVGITDNAQERSPHNMVSVVVEKVSRDIAVSVDNKARSVYSAAGADLFGGSGNTNVAGVAAGDVITADLVKNGVALLRNLDVKPLANGLYGLVASPLVIRDLVADSDFVDEMRHADPSTFLNGQVAKYAGAAIIDAGSRGIVLEGDGTSGIDVYFATLIGADSIFAALSGLTIIPATGPDKSDPLNRRDLYSWKGLLGAVANDVQAQRFLNIAVAASLG